jgi:hypothetical protein
MMRKAETGASVRVIELPGDRLGRLPISSPAASKPTRTSSTFSRTGRSAPARLCTCRKRAYATPWASGTSTRRYVTGGRSLVAARRLPALAGATAAGRARHDSRPGRSPTVDPPPGAVHGRGEQGAPCAALLVSGGGRRRSRRAGKAVADDINAAVESAEGASWGR